jgi:hypothetical protein
MGNYLIAKDGYVICTNKTCYIPGMYIIKDLLSSELTTSDTGSGEASLLNF